MANDQIGRLGTSQCPRPCVWTWSAAGAAASGQWAGPLAAIPAPSMFVVESVEESGAIKPKYGKAKEVGGRYGDRGTKPGVKDVGGKAALDPSGSWNL